MITFSPQELGDYFAEFFERKVQCKFNDRLHR